MGRRAFTDFIQIRNLREGFKVDGAVISLYFDLIVGAFTINGVSWHNKSGSIRLNAGRRVTMKASYVKTIQRLVAEAIKDVRRNHSAKQISEID